MIILISTFAFSGMEQEKKSAAEKMQNIVGKSGIKAALEWYAKLKHDKKKQYDFNEKEFINLGISLRSSGNVHEAIQILKLAVEIFPKSSEAWQNLGYAQMRFLKKDTALKCYQMAIKLNPKNMRTKEELQLIDMRMEQARHETKVKMKFKPGQNTGLKGPYLGQSPPGLKPELFAPGIISVYGSNENTVTISPDGKEIYFGKEPGIWVCKLTEKGWTAPEKTNIKGYEMWISPKTGKMYYSGYGIWVMERIKNEWGNPKRLLKKGMFSTLTLDEILYTTVFKKGANIGRYRKIDGRYSEPEIFGPEINNPKSFDAHPNVAPDESFVIFDSDRTGKTGLYISFRNENDSWSKAKYLGDEYGGNCSTLSPDGKYLFFMKHQDIYWVSTKIIEKLRLKDLK